MKNPRKDKFIRYHKLIIIVLFAVFACKKAKEENKHIYYSLSNNIDLAIMDGINAVIDSRLNYNKNNFFISVLDVSSDNEVNELMLSYCEDCEVAELLEKTNRYCIVGEKINLPIIFEADSFFTKLNKGSETRKNSYRLFIRFDSKKDNVQLFTNP